MKLFIESVFDHGEDTEDGAEACHAKEGGDINSDSEGRVGWLLDGIFKIFLLLITVIDHSIYCFKSKFKNILFIR